MRVSYALPAWLMLAGASVAGCLGTGHDRVLDIEATGFVEGLVYFDANGTREFDEDDAPLLGVGVRLLVLGTTDTLARASSDRDGISRMRDVPVGGYEIVVDPASVDDSLHVVDIDPAIISVNRDDSIATFIALSFLKVSVEDARELPVGDKVFVEGIALNSRETFGDLSVHLAGSSAAIRVTRVRSSVIFAGDSVRFLGTTSRLDGQPTLDDVTPFLIDIAQPPAPEIVSTVAADNADGGRLDAALVRVLNARITNTATVAGGLELTVDDDSGELEVLLDESVPFSDPSQYVPGVVIDATGLLVPTGSGTWRLKPRSDSDLAVR